MSALGWLILAVFVNRVQYRICGTTYGSRYCGIGPFDEVLAKKTDSPMAYRVLFPWITAGLERAFPRLRPYRERFVYETLKVLFLWLALWTAERAIGTAGALLVAAVLPVTFLFDYWDWEVELFALAAALTGNLPLALAGVVLDGLSRETAPFVVVTYGLVTHDWPGTALLAVACTAVLAGVRLWAGYHEFVFPRFPFAQNRHALKFWWTHLSITHNITQTLLLTGVTLAAVASGRAGPAWPVALGILVAGWSMALINETRLFTGCLLWVAIAATGAA